MSAETSGWAYFPPTSPGSEPVVGEFCATWYGKHLAAMKEPSLHDAAGSARQVYRFLWLRSFHHPIVVRIEKTEDGIRLIAKELDGKGGYAPGKLLSEKTRPLHDSEWTDLLKLVEKSSFWKMPTKEAQTYFDPQSGLEVGWSMADGAQWIVEAVEDGKYHVVDRQSPDEDKHRDCAVYGKMCLFMLKLSGLSVERIY